MSIEELVFYNVVKWYFLYILAVLLVYMMNKAARPNRCGVIFRPKSFWIGIHHSNYCKRTCINILPCVTIWIGTKPIKL